MGKGRDEEMERGEEGVRRWFRRGKGEERRKQEETEREIKWRVVMCSYDYSIRLRSSQSVSTSQSGWRGPSSVSSVAHNARPQYAQNLHLVRRRRRLPTVLLTLLEFRQLLLDLDDKRIDPLVVWNRSIRILINRRQELFVLEPSGILQGFLRGVMIQGREIESSVGGSPRDVVVEVVVLGPAEVFLRGRSTMEVDGRLWLRSGDLVHQGSGRLVRVGLRHVEKKVVLERKTKIKSSQ